MLTDVKREYEILIETQRQDLSHYEILKSKLSVMEYRTINEIDKVKSQFQILIEEMRCFGINVASKKMN